MTEPGIVHELVAATERFKGRACLTAWEAGALPNRPPSAACFSARTRPKKRRMRVSEKSHGPVDLLLILRRQGGDAGTLRCAASSACGECVDLRRSGPSTSAASASIRAAEAAGSSTASTSQCHTSVALAAMGDGAGLGVEPDEAVVARAQARSGAPRCPPSSPRAGEDRIEQAQEPRDSRRRIAGSSFETAREHRISGRRDGLSDSPAPAREDVARRRGTRTRSRRRTSSGDPMAIIYKICPAALWREAEATGVFHGSPVDLARRLHPFLDRARRSRRPRRGISPGRTTWSSSRSTRAARGRRSATSRRAAASSSRTSTAPLDLAAVLSVKPLPLGADGRHRFPELRREPAVARAAAAPLRRSIPRRRIGWRSAALQCGLHPRPAARRPAPPAAAPRPRLPQPARHRPPGFDKNAEVPDALLGLGFGFVEVGTVTPRPQTGNPRRACSASSRDGAVINRLGFNKRRPRGGLSRGSRRGDAQGIVGVNIGANKDSADRVADYVAGVTRFADVADYLAVNVSSPNTPGLRDLQEQASARRPARARGRRARRASGACRSSSRSRPTSTTMRWRSSPRRRLPSGIDGMIVTNTTVARDGVAGPRAGGGGRRPVRPAAVRPLDGDARQGSAGLVGQRAGADRRRRHRFRRSGACQDPRRRRPRPALHRPGLSRGPDLPARLVAGAAAAAGKAGADSIAAVVGVDADRRGPRRLNRLDALRAASTAVMSIPEGVRTFAGRAPEKRDAADADEDEQRDPQAGDAERSARAATSARDRPRATGASCCACRPTRSRR